MPLSLDHHRPLHPYPHSHGDCVASATTIVESSHHHHSLTDRKSNSDANRVPHDSEMSRRIGTPSMHGEHDSKKMENQGQVAVGMTPRQSRIPSLMDSVRYSMSQWFPQNWSITEIEAKLSQEAKPGEFYVRQNEDVPNSYRLTFKNGHAGYAYDEGFSVPRWGTNQQLRCYEHCSSSKTTNNNAQRASQFNAHSVRMWTKTGVQWSGIESVTVFFTVSEILKDEQSVLAHQISYEAESVEWASQHASWTSNRGHVIFGDQKKFNLDGPNGLAYYRHDIRKEKIIFFSTRFHCGSSVMIWTAIFEVGKSQLAILFGNQTADNHVTTRNNFLLPSLTVNLQSEYVFQQDGAVIHKIYLTKHFLLMRNIHVLDWSPHSPDVKPHRKSVGFTGEEENGEIKFIDIDGMSHGFVIRHTSPEYRYSSLTHLVASHCQDVGILPCLLKLPQTGSSRTTSSMVLPMRQPPVPSHGYSHEDRIYERIGDRRAFVTERQPSRVGRNSRMTRSMHNLLPHGAACKLYYLGQFNVGTAKSSHAIDITADYVINNGLQTLQPVLIDFHVNESGITLHDSEQRHFSERHYPASFVQFIGLDRKHRTIFGFLSRNPNHTSADNQCHLLAEYDKSESAKVICEFTTRYLQLGDE